MVLPPILSPVYLGLSLLTLLTIISPISSSSLSSSFTFSSSAYPCTFFVNNNPSTSSSPSLPFTSPLGSYENPFTTIQAAQYAVRQRLQTLRTITTASNNRTDDAPSSIKVCLMEGIYRETLVFDAIDSGLSSTAPVIYTAYLGQNVSLTGGINVTFQSISPDDPIYAYVNSSLIPSLYVTDLTTVGLTNITDINQWLPRGFLNNGCANSPMEFIYQDTVQTVARYPNVNESLGTTPGFALTEWAIGHPWTTNSCFFVNTTVPFPYYKDIANGWFQGFWYYEWADGYYRYLNQSLVTINDQTYNYICFRPTDAVNVQVTAGARYQVFNVLDALDSPGEYYINTTNNRLYFYPPSTDPSPPTGIVTVNTTLLTLNAGTANLWFEGITIENTRGNGADLTSTNNIVFRNCTVRNIGNAGIMGYLSNNTLVQGNTIVATGGAGVRLMNGGDRYTLTPSGNMIVDNTVHYFERLCYTYNAAVDIDTGGIIAHNDIAYGPHNGITLDGNDVLVQGNIVHHTTAHTFDNGAIYWYPVDWSKQNTTIRYNFFYLNAQDPSTCNSQTSCGRHALYADNGNAGITIESNVIWHPNPANTNGNLPCPSCRPITDIVSYGYMDDGGRDSLVRNNIFVMDTANITFNGAAGLTWDMQQEGNSSLYFQKLHAVQWNTGLYAERYPTLSTLYDYWPTGGVSACAQDERCGAAPYGNQFVTNVMVNVNTVMTYPPPSSDFNPNNFNITNNLVNIDPLFVETDPRSTLNFQLQDDSPAYALGFERIPMECFGPYQRCPNEPDWGH